METIKFFTTLQLGWLNGWIFAFAFIIVQLFAMMIGKEGGKRAVDMSWYTSKDKRNASVNSMLQVVLLLLSIFAPLKTGTTWFTFGTIIFAFALIFQSLAFYTYMTAPLDKAITKGVYGISRNPQYFAFSLGMLGVCIASASLWLFIVWIPFVLATHAMIKGEERYCEQKYGQDYLNYKNKVTRYFWFF